MPARSRWKLAVNPWFAAKSAAAVEADLEEGFPPSFKPAEAGSGGGIEPVGAAVRARWGSCRPTSTGSADLVRADIGRVGQHEIDPPATERPGRRMNSARERRPRGISPATASAVGDVVPTPLAFGSSERAREITRCRYRCRGER
jgi:hypothetical protein